MKNLWKIISALCLVSSVAFCYLFPLWFAVSSSWCGYAAVGSFVTMLVTGSFLTAAPPITYSKAFERVFARILYILVIISSVAVCTFGSYMFFALDRPSWGGYVLIASVVTMLVAGQLLTAAPPDALESKRYAY